MRKDDHGSHMKSNQLILSGYHVHSYEEKNQQEHCRKVSKVFSSNYVIYSCRTRSNQFKSAITNSKTTIHHSTPSPLHRPRPPKSSKQPSHHSNTPPSPSLTQQTALYAPPQSIYLSLAYLSSLLPHVYLPLLAPPGSLHNCHNRLTRLLPMLLRRLLWVCSGGKRQSNWEVKRYRDGGSR
jgi:hypothetical protein